MVSADPDAVSAAERRTRPTMAVVGALGTRCNGSALKVGVRLCAVGVYFYGTAYVV